MKDSCTEYFVHKYDFLQTAEDLKRSGMSKMERSGSLGGFDSKKTLDWELEKTVLGMKKEESQRIQETIVKIEELKEIVNKVEENNSYLQAQVRLYENEVKVLNKQLENERNDWALQVDKLENELDYANNINFYKEIVDSDTAYQFRKTNFELELKKKSIVGENSQLRKKLEEEKLNFTQKLKQKDDLIDKLQFELSKSQAEIKNLQILSEKQRFDLKILSEAPEYQLKTSKKSNSKHLTPNQFLYSESNRQKKPPESAVTKSVFHKKCKNVKFSIPKPSHPLDFGRKSTYVGYDSNQELFLKDKIKKLESEISDVNKDYKKLLTSTKPGSKSYLKYKKEINSVAKMLETRSKSLYSDKRRYSSLISRNSLSSDFD